MPVVDDVPAEKFTLVTGVKSISLTNLSISISLSGLMVVSIT